MIRREGRLAGARKHHHTSKPKNKETKSKNSRMRTIFAISINSLLTSLIKTMNTLLHLQSFFSTLLLTTIISTALAIPTSPFPTDGIDPAARTAQIRINDRVHTIMTPLDPSPEQIRIVDSSGRPGSTLIPFVGGIINLPEKTDIYSADLISGRPGFGFAFWSSAEDGPFVSESINEDNRILKIPDRRLYPPPSFPKPEPASAARGRAIRFPAAERLVWYIQEDRRNSFVALAEYDGSPPRQTANDDEGFGFDVGGGSSPIRTELQIFEFRPTNLVGLEYNILGYHETAKWRFPYSGWFGRRGSRQSIPTEASSDDEDSSSNNNNKAAAVKKLAVLEMAPQFSDRAGPVPTGPDCFALGRYPWQYAIDISPASPLINPPHQIVELFCTPGTSQNYVQDY